MIDPGTGDETLRGAMDGYGACEALEHAFGDEAPRIKVPSGGHDVVPDSWTQDGILFGFDPTSGSLLIINPADGTPVRWDCALQSVDCKAIVFTTQQRDPFRDALDPRGD